MAASSLDACRGCRSWQRRSRRPAPVSSGAVYIAHLRHDLSADEQEPAKGAADTSDDNHAFSFAHSFAAYGGRDDCLTSADHAPNARPGHTNQPTSSAR